MKRILAVFFITLSINAFTQDKELTLEDAILKRRSTFNPESVKALQWTKNPNEYSFTKEDAIMLGATNKEESSKLVSVGELNTLLKLPEDDKIQSIPSINWLTAKDFWFYKDNNIYIYDLDKKQVASAVQFNENAADQDFAPKTLKLAYTVDDNLYIASGKTETQVTTDGGNGIVNGKAVHRYEFGIYKGTFWSPHENYLAFYRKDESMVADYPLVDISTKPASLNSIKYPMAGEKSHHVTLRIYDVKNKKTTFIKTGEPKEQYLTNIAWSPDEKYIYIAVLNRDQNHMKFNQYDVATGELVKMLFEEKDEQYVQPLHPMYWLKDHKQFVWNSRKEGYRQLYLYNADGTFVRKLTTENWDVFEILGQDKSGENLIITGTGANGTETQIFSVSIANGKTTNISNESGTHTAQLSEGGEYIIDVFSSLDTPRNTRIIAPNGKEVKTLLKAENPMSDYKIGETSIFTIKAADEKTDLYCRMIKPFDFDESKKYPVLVYVYNGPGVQLIQNDYLASAPLWMSEFANRGYLVFTVDGRGSSNRGEEFEQATFRDLGTKEIEDQLKGVEYLKSLSYIDQDRMAVHGWSYGGFMTTSLMLRAPGTFKVGVAGGPVIDWKYYEIMYTERFMDTPQTNPDGYERASLLNKVKALDGKLLMIHGTVDDVVVWQHSLDFVKTCVDEGVQIDYFPYPQHPHNVRGKDRVHLMTKVLDYIEENL